MLDLRLATWVAMGVPISFLGAILFFAPFGVNINMISLFALIIVLGIVVDDAVVVGENIITEQENTVLTRQRPRVRYSRSFQPGVHWRADHYGSLCPLLGTGGLRTDFLTLVPIVVILVLSMCRRWQCSSFCQTIRLTVDPGAQAHSKVFCGLGGREVMSFRDRVFLPSVSWTVQRRYFALLCGICFLVVAAATVSSGAVRFIFFPALESDTIRANLTFPVGTTRTTEAAANRIIEALHQVNDNNGTAFSAISATIGGQAARVAGQAAAPP